MKCQKIFFFVFALQAMILPLCYANQNEVVEKIARQMHTSARDCEKLSSDEMAHRRLQFLNENKDATAAELVKAIEMKIDGQDIMTLFRSLNGRVCEKCTAKMKSDYDLGRFAVNWYLGNTLIAEAMPVLK